MRNLKNALINLLQIQYPIIQAPMAGGITTSSLVSAVSNEGGLGNIGAGYLDAKGLQNQIKEVKNLTSNPFGVNIFIPQKVDATAEEIRAAYDLLQPYRKELNIKSEVPSFRNGNIFDEQIKVIMEEKVPVVSFTFGLPSREVVSMLKERGIVVIGTATTVKEAVMNEEIGMDAVVVQGSEAGGHRGSFLKEGSKSLIGLMSLIPQVADNVSIPIIAAGGIMDGRGIVAATVLGAQGVQMGTAFVTCKESGAHPLYKEAVLHATEDEAVLTKVFSGKEARGIQNKFILEMTKYESHLPPYPIQNTLTSEIRKSAKKANQREYMSLWSGQSPRLSKDVTVRELFQKITLEIARIYAPLLDK